MKEWYKQTADETIRELGSESAGGLDNTEARRRLDQYGRNEIIERGLKSPWRIVWEQLSATMVVILIVAAGISAALGDYKDTAAILAIVVLNTILGFTQENRAERAIAMLRKMAVPVVKVRRSGRLVEVSARDLVPGDILVLEAGDIVPADCRLVEATNLRVQEAALTGESLPVEKSTEVVAGDAGLGDRLNMAYMGTAVSYGRGIAVVTGTGMSTELGRIASMIQSVVRERTPLQKRLDHLGAWLAIVALCIVAIVFALGLLRGEDLTILFLTSISMAVAAVPEGLPAVVTIALALGAQRMLKRRALIRKLPAVETLGSVTVICSDKTGTLTENKMTVTEFDLVGREINVSELEQNKDLKALLDQPSVALMLTGLVLCNDAVVESDGQRKMGDPTETALLEVAAKAGLSKSQLEDSFPRAGEAPFDSERRRMTTVHEASRSDEFLKMVVEIAGPGGRPADGQPFYLSFTKGSADAIAEIASHVLVESGREPMTQDLRKRISEANDRLAAKGMRVLGLGFRVVQGQHLADVIELVERDVVFIGLVAMIDPPRSEAKEAVLTCRKAGIRPVMITGDHPLTARQIASQLGIDHERRTVTGEELARLAAEELKEMVDEVSVYARVSPEHKLKIITALQERGHVVAMTGDGVNDAPALKKANIGVAMGITGTAVSKEASDIVLLDDNFATIVAAVEEGRVIYDNIRKFVKYIVTTNSGEIWVMLLAPLLGMPLPLLPVQILWMNLVTDGPLALALAIEPAERDTMSHPPYPPNESIFARGLGRHIVWVGALMSLVSLGIGYAYWGAGYDQWQTMIFTTLTLSQIGHVLAIRSSRDSLFRMGLLTNIRLMLAAILTFALQLVVIYTPWLQTFFGTVDLSPRELLLSLLLGSVVFWAVEIEKWIMRRRERTASDRKQRLDLEGGILQR